MSTPAPRQRLQTNSRPLPAPHIPAYYPQDQSRTDFNTLASCILHPETSSIDNVAATLATQINSGDVTLPDDDARHPANRTIQIFTSVAKIAIQTPWDHVAQLRLMELLKALRRQPGPPENVREAIRESDGSAGDFTWASLPTFSFLTHELWDYHVPLPGHATRVAGPGWSVKEWLNYNGFLSLLLAEGVSEACQPGLGFEMLALRCLCLALEYDLGVAELGAMVPAAAMWSLNAGEWVRRACDGGLMIGGRVQDLGRKLYHGPEGFCAERWEFWMRRFEEIAIGDGVPVETVGWALRAAEVMEEMG
ncbi:hypothetical protein LTR27_012807 [Elasticomyces elasticus]|nr:hypothetical protein LTR27_012807 [Elasticomyces elasticus]